MKKARIVLALVATLGVVGAVSAFKAQKAFSLNTYYVTTVYNASATLTYKFAITTLPIDGTYYYITYTYDKQATVPTYVTTSLESE